ncbi:hypothetical protein [Tepidimonas thermarum]|uniref:hypothetical protein n=1 Tax=Tepidimonas thermarum TaxID=335431 RepID=UPI00163D42BA|nr:hypothetical protein [Tepidimonas thermarum]
MVGFFAFRAIFGCILAAREKADARRRYTPCQDFFQGVQHAIHLSPSAARINRLCNLFSVNFRLGGHDNRVTG